MQPRRDGTVKLSEFIKWGELVCSIVGGRARVLYIRKQCWGFIRASTDPVTHGIERYSAAKLAIICRRLIALKLVDHVR